MKMKLYVAAVLVENNGTKSLVTARYYEEKTVEGIVYCRSDPEKKFGKKAVLK